MFFILVTALAFYLAPLGEVCINCNTETDLCSFMNYMSHCKSISRSTEAVQYHINTAVYPLTVKSPL